MVAIEPQTGKVRVMVSIPEYDPNLIPRDFGRLNTDPEQADAQPHHPGALSARLDVQGGDRDRGARQRQGDARDDHRRLVAEGDQRRRRSRTRAARASARSRLTDALTNSVNTVFAQVGEQVGRGDAGRVHEALRLLRGPGARLPGRPDDPERRAPQRRRHVRARTASTSGAWRSARAAPRARSTCQPDADGARWPRRSRNGGPADEAAPDRPRRAQGRAREGAHRARPAVAR